MITDTIASRWQEEFQRKLTSAEDAVKIVQSGNRVVIPPTSGHVLAAALAKRRAELRNIRITYCAPSTDPGWLQPGWRESFDVEIEVYIGEFGRRATDEHVASFLPNLWSTAFRAADEGRPEAQDCDVLFLTVTPPDETGYCCVGPFGFNKMPYVRRAKRILAEIDSNLIRVHGDCFVHVSEVEHFIEATPPPVTMEAVQGWLSGAPAERQEEMLSIISQINSLQRLAALGKLLGVLQPDDLRRFLFMPMPVPDHVKSIAGYVEELVPDGATIQLGAGDPAGALPQLGTFDKKHDLGLHTEIACPGLAKLVAQGIINGKYKTVNRGKAVAISWIGSNDEDLAIIANNPHFELQDSSYIADIKTISAHDNMIAMNNALTVDLVGQINAENTFGTRLINGVGGQTEFHIGAFFSKGGRAITLLPSTAVGGSVSRIVAQHEAGAMVTVPRFFADTVITEYGVARLLDKNHRQRAYELIGIAHPDFRSELRAQAEKLF